MSVNDMQIAQEIEHIRRDLNTASRVLSGEARDAFWDVIADLVMSNEMELAEARRRHPDHKG